MRYWGKASRASKHKAIRDRVHRPRPVPLIYTEAAPTRPGDFDIYSEKRLDRAPDQLSQTLSDEEIGNFLVGRKSVREIAAHVVALLMWCASLNVHWALRIVDARGFHIRVERGIGMPYAEVGLNVRFPSANMEVQMSHLSDEDEPNLSPNCRSFLKSAAAAGLTSAAILGVSSVLPLRAFAADGAPTGTLTFGNAEPPTANYWDPAAGFGLVDEQVASLVHDTLIGWDENGKMVPSVATTWKLESPTTVALTIRSDVKFHDGSPLTAEEHQGQHRSARLGQARPVNGGDARHRGKHRLPEQYRGGVADSVWRGP